MIITLSIFLLIIISILLMVVVLLQSSKGNGLAGPIGGSSVTMAFGVRRTSDILTKATTILASVLIVGCIAVNLLIGNERTGGDESIIQKNAGQQQQQMPPPTNVPPTGNQPPAGTDQPDQNDQDKAPEEAPPLDK